MVSILLWLISGLAVLCLATGADAATPGQDGHVGLTAARVLNQAAIPVYGYRIVATYPHDTAAYTEGLQMVGGTMYESSGLWGRSLLRQWDLKTGKILHETRLAKVYFGEGTTVLGPTAYQLTYLGNTGFTYDSESLRRLGKFHYVEQGWGLTNDGTDLLVSDGSSSIQFRDPKTYKLSHRIFVTDNVGPVGFLNELEYDRGKLYANVWQTNFIAIIDPQSGRVKGWIDLTGLNPDPKKLVYPLVLNGIAVDSRTGNLLVTGKCWPHVWQIELVPRHP